MRRQYHGRKGARAAVRRLKKHPHAIPGRERNARISIKQSKCIIVARNHHWPARKPEFIRSHSGPVYMYAHMRGEHGIERIDAAHRIRQCSDIRLKTGGKIFQRGYGQVLNIIDPEKRGSIGLSRPYRGCVIRQRCERIPRASVAYRLRELSNNAVRAETVIAGQYRDTWM